MLVQLIHGHADVVLGLSYEGVQRDAGQLTGLIQECMVLSFEVLLLGFRLKCEALTILRHIHNSGHSIEEPLDVVIPVRVSIRVVSNGVVKPVRDRTLAHALMLQNGILAQFNDSAMHVLTPSLQYPYPSQKTAPSDNQDRF